MVLYQDKMNLLLNGKTGNTGVKNVNKARDNRIDILKGICICFMVIGHSGAPDKLVSFIYLFHMSIFFIASGYFWDSKNTDDISKLVTYIKKKVKNLYFVYVGTVGLYAIFHNILYGLCVYTDNPVFLLYMPGRQLIGRWSVLRILEEIGRAAVFKDNGATQLASAMWFVSCLFQLVILYAIVEYILKIIRGPHYIQIIISVLFSIMGFICSKLGISGFGFARALSCYVLFELGVIVKCIEKYKWCNYYIYRICSWIISIVILYCSIDKVYIALVSNIYNNPLVLVVDACAGWICFIRIASALSKCKMAKIFAIIGKNTIWIVALHFLAFKLINLVGVIGFNQPKCLIAAYFTAYADLKNWWIYYSLVGIFVPSIVAIIVKKLIAVLQGRFRLFQH